MAPSDRWPVLPESPPGRGSSVFVGPLALPGSSRKRLWVWLLLWTLLVFAGGVAAGPTVTSQAIGLVEGAYSMLGRTPPQFVGQLKPATGTATPALPLIEPLPAAGVEQGAGAPTAVPGSVAGQAAKPAQPGKPAGVVAPQLGVRAGAAGTQSRADPVSVVMPVAHSPHAKGEAKATSDKAAPERTAESTPAAAPAATTFHDPFVEDSDSASQPAPAAPTRKSKASFEDFGPAVKSEPEPKPTASPSRDSLDSLMADVVTERKDKPRAGKGVDAILSKVHDGRAETPAQREAQAPLPPLSQTDISRVMAGVRMRGKDCARKFDQDGIAELTLVVGKDGAVTDVSLGGKLTNTLVGACIERAARAAAFPRSAGLRFEYRVDVR
jgi:hypothetical protein